MSQQHPAAAPDAGHGALGDASGELRDPQEPAPGGRGRRSLLLGGAAAVAAAGACALDASPARAAAGGALLLGRSNSAQSGVTSVSMATTGTGLRVAQSSTGAAGGFSAVRGTALVAQTAHKDRYGLLASAAATTTGLGAAVRAQGRHNPGLYADTADAQDVPALVAIGGRKGDGVAQVAKGESYLDGDALALRSWVGVLAAGSKLAYAHVVSGEGPQHSAHGTATLEANGTVLVALPAAFVVACDTGDLTVTLTAIGQSMPGLYVTYRAVPGSSPVSYDGFTISGGAPNAKVAWVAWATRRAVKITGGATVASPPPVSTSAATPSEGAPSGGTAAGATAEPPNASGAPQAVRRARRPLSLPRP